MRAIDALKEGKITRQKFDALVKEHGPKIGRSYPIAVQVVD